MNIRPFGNALQPGPALLDKGTPAPAQLAIKAQAPATPVETSVAAQQPAPVPNMRELEHAVEHINKTVKALSPSLEFSLDKDSNRTVLKIVDNQTKEVIRQVPSEEALEIAKALDKLQGLIIKQKA